MSGSLMAANKLSEKNCVESLHDYSQLLEKELGLTIINIIMFIIIFLITYILRCVVTKVDRLFC